MALFRIALVAFAVSIPGGAWGGEPAPVAVGVTLETTGGEQVAGTLEAIDSREIRIASDGATRTLPIDAVRAVNAKTGAGGAAAAAVAMICADGSTLSGDDVSWDGDAVTLARPEGTVTLPVTRVRSIAWRDAKAEAATAAEEPAWMQSLPEQTGSDLVIVRQGDGFQFVECAITGISAESVTVILDGETIPVKRAKILGLHWLREPLAAGVVEVRVTGGTLHAGTVGWSPAALVVDDAIRLPAAMLQSVDYASGRTVRLATLPTERLEVEPFFGALGKLDGVADYFRPRPVAGAGGGPPQDLLIRPRTVATWRVPPDSRTFTATLSPAAAASGGGGVVVIVVDDREVFRGAVDPPAGVGDGRLAIGPILLDKARRLTVTVDYGPAGSAAGGVLFHNPVFSR